MHTPTAPNPRQTTRDTDNRRLSRAPGQVKRAVKIAASVRGRDDYGSRATREGQLAPDSLQWRTTCVS